ncbi:MAG TPA: sodium:solute symporter [Acidimicrobiales bacterium]|nr:sodium:solute symporter [Acidimicrobiales bacterium]
MLATIKASQLTVFTILFLGITVVGFGAARWRRGDLGDLTEWGLGGRRFGTFVTWYLLGGDLYTAYTFIAVPALVFGKGALGLFALPFTIVVFPIIYLVMPRLWQVARNRGHLTISDFVKERFQSPLLAVLVAITGIVAIIPYISLQIYGIEVCIAEMGIPVDASLTIAFAVLVAFTAVSGLRAPTLIAAIKDTLIWITVLVAVIYLPLRLGGYAHIFAHVPTAKLVLPTKDFAGYSSLALGSALFLFLYPHAITGTYSASSKRAVERNAAYLPVYSILLGLIALLGYFAIAAGIHANGPYGKSGIVPALFERFFPGPFAGFAFAAVSIGALVPAAIMSVSAANLFSRNIWREFIRPRATAREEGLVARVVSAIIKFGALGFILGVTTQYVLYFQTGGGAWILQTLPAVFLAVWCGWLDRRATIAGWAVGIAWSTYLLFAVGFKTSFYSFAFLGHTTLFLGIPPLVANLIVTFGGTGLLRLLGMRPPPQQIPEIEFQVTVPAAVSPAPSEAPVAPPS